MTEYEKMQRGEVYLATDPSLLRELHACQDKCWEYNRFCPTDARRRNEMIREILGGADEDTFVNQPFHCDYGKHIFVGKRFFSNFNFTVLDEARVSIGDNVTIGAGSVVVKDIPSNSVAVGNPARVVRTIKAATTTS